MVFKNNDKINITLLPSGRRVTSFKSTNLKNIISEANLSFSFPCGGEGVCGKCKVKIKGDVNPPTHREKELIPGELLRGYRLACQVILKGDTQVEIPRSSLVSTLQILTTDSGEGLEVKPSIKKIFLSLDPPSLKDQTSDISRIKRGLKKMGYGWVKVDLDVVRRVPFILRESDFKVSCVLDKKRLITVEKGDTRGKNFAMAFDIGTTTVVGSLIDLDTGERVATEAVLNPQNIYGFDVISRISYIQKKGSKGLVELQKSIINGVNKLIGSLLKKTKIKKDNVYKLNLVGNTVMQHLFAGINPVNLSLHPYVSVIQDAICIKSSKLNIKINPSARLFMFPNIAAFVGGDTVGLILSTALHRTVDKVRLAVDVGTNGEIVLSQGGRLVATSTAAGPAFEGVRISQGMLAKEGAIEKVQLKEGEVLTEVIGNSEAKGICGSGLIDAVSELYREGIVDRSGRIKANSEQKKVWANRIVEEKGGRRFMLLKGKSTIFISQRDIREFQLAKAAICTGIKVLLNKLGVDKEKVQEFLIAGAFGNYINLHSAYRLGLFPIFPQAQVRTVGNAASLGAIKSLLSQNAQQEIKKIPSIVHHVELATSPDFQRILSESMFLEQVN